MTLMIVSPANAPDPIFIDPKKVHTLIGPVTVQEPIKPGEVKQTIELRILMDAGVTHTIRFSNASEAETKARAIFLASAE